jgi:hypothetical protein
MIPDNAFTMLRASERQPKIPLWALHLTGVEGDLPALTPAPATSKVGKTVLSHCLAHADAS